MMKKSYIATVSSAALAATMLFTASASAQVSPGAATSEDNEPGDITVTARKRLESAQSIPDPISVVTEKMIANADLRTVQDAVRLTPNLVILDGLYPGYKTVSFRGFTTLGRDGEFPFATIIDGVVQPGQMNFQQELVNVQQIEVLRGPQGTLYGGGAIAGAINVVTKQPTNDFHGGAAVQFLNGPEGRINTSLSGPIVADKLFFQVGATVYQTDGLIPNTARDDNADFGKGVTARASLIFTPTDNLKFALAASSTDSRVGGLYLAQVPDTEFDGSAVDPDEDVPGIVRTKLRNASFKVDYTFPDFATLTSITAYSRGRDYTTADGDFSRASINVQDVRFVDKAWSQEVRLTSEGSGKLKWNAGIFYQEETRDSLSHYGPVTVPQTFASASISSREYKTFAMFGQASYDLTDSLELTGGFRFDWEHQNYYSPVSDLYLKQTFREPQGKAAISYKVTPDVFTYLSYSRGYRKGGFNPNSETSLRSYNPEKADTIEGGVKTNLWDRKITLNGAVFYTAYKGQILQTSRVIPEVGVFIAISNIEKTDVYGFEAEASIRPVQGLSLSGSVGYSDVKIKKFLPEDPDAYHNNRTPQIYGFTAQAGIDIDTPIVGDFELIAHGDVSHRGSVYWDIQNVLKTSPTTFFNAKIGVRKGDWTLSLVGRNLSNERTPMAVGPHAFGGGTISLASYNTPRQYGAELAVKF